MATKDTFNEISRKIYREVITKDCYLMSDYRSDFFDTIIDIGANVGIFTLYAHMRHPHAKIFAYEPFLDTFNYLCDHLYKKTFTSNIVCINKALGDGSVLFSHDSGYGGCNLFFSDDESQLPQEYSVKSLSLPKMFEENKISTDGKYYIKIDCEGGERFLLNDNKVVDLIKKSSGLGLEVHFPPIGNKKRPSSVARFGTFPEWHVYNAWVNDNFASSHRIIYHKSSKRLGSGVYVLFNKNIYSA